MEAKDENLLVKVLKKAVGLPTGNSSCACSATVPVVNECCSGEVPESVTPECGCAKPQSEQEEPTPQ